MKYVLAFVATLFFVGTSALPLVGTDFNKLDQDLIDFYRTVGLQKLSEITLEHSQDPELIASFEYLKTEELHNLLYAVEELPEFKKFVLYLDEAGYAIVRALKGFHILFELEPYVPPNASGHRVAREAGLGGVAGYVRDVLAILPHKELQELHEKKVKESPVFAKFSSYLRSEKYAQILKDLLAQEAFANFSDELLMHGINIEAIYDVENQLYGFK